MVRFKLQRSYKAPLEKVWAAADFTKSANPFRMVVEDKGDLQGVGFQRAVFSGKRKVIERLLSVDPQRSFTYTLVDGAPVKKGYQGKVEFAQNSEYTQIIWSCEFEPKTKGTGWLIALMIKWTINKILDAIGEELCR